MARTSYGVNDTLAVKLWSKKLAVEALKETFFARFIGEGTDSLIQLKTETQKSPGDRITVGLRMQLSGDGVTEGQTLEGNEESLTTYSDNILINELAHAVRVRNNGTIDAQRVPFDLRNEAKSGLRDWYANRMDSVFFNHLAGYTAEARSVYVGNNTIVAPSSTRWIRAGSQANDQSIISSNLFTIDLIDKAKEMAMTATPLIRPIMVNGESKFVMFLHPYQVTDMRTNTSNAQWFDIQRAALQGGQVTNNPIYTGALGEYNGVILHSAFRVPNGINASTGAVISTVRRAVLCGAQAGALAFGNGSSDSKFNWVEELFDYERELGVSAQAVFGFKKLVFNSLDFATVVVSTYAAAHT